MDEYRPTTYPRSHKYYSGILSACRFSSLRILCYGSRHFNKLSYCEGETIWNYTEKLVFCPPMNDAGPHYCGENLRCIYNNSFSQKNTSRSRNSLLFRMRTTICILYIAIYKALFGVYDATKQRRPKVVVRQTTLTPFRKASLSPDLLESPRQR